MGILVVCILVFTVFCIVCTVFLYCFFYVYLFLFVLSVIVKDDCQRVTTQLQVVEAVVVVVVVVVVVAVVVVTAPLTAKRLRSVWAFISSFDNHTAGFCRPPFQDGVRQHTRY